MHKNNLKKISIGLLFLFVAFMFFISGIFLYQSVPKAFNLTEQQIWYYQWIFELKKNKGL